MVDFAVHLRMCVDSCGKVCLSLLGTWDGQQGEQWNETTSTVLQVFLNNCCLLTITFSTHTSTSMS